MISSFLFDQLYDSLFCFLIYYLFLGGLFRYHVRGFHGRSPGSVYPFYFFLSSATCLIGLLYIYLSFSSSPGLMTLVLRSPTLRNPQGILHTVRPPPDGRCFAWEESGRVNRRTAMDRCTSAFPGPILAILFFPSSFLLARLFTTGMDDAGVADAPSIAICISLQRY